MADRARGLLEAEGDTRALSVGLHVLDYGLRTAVSKMVGRALYAQKKTAFQISLHEPKKKQLIATQSAVRLFSFRVLDNGVLAVHNTPLLDKGAVKKNCTNSHNVAVGAIFFSPPPCSTQQLFKAVSERLEVDRVTVGAETQRKSQGLSCVSKILEVLWVWLTTHISHCLLNFSSTCRSAPRLTLSSSPLKTSVRVPSSAQQTEVAARTSQTRILVWQGPSTSSPLAREPRSFSAHVALSRKQNRFRS